MTLTFERTTDTPVLIEIVIDDSSHIDEFITACRSGAYALGYGMSSIVERFKTTDELDSIESMTPLEEDY